MKINIGIGNRVKRNSTTSHCQINKSQKKKKKKTKKKKKKKKKKNNSKNLKS